MPCATWARALGEPGDTDELRYYNGLSHTEIGDGHGFKKLGVENVIPIFTRGVLIDVAASKGRMYDRGEEVTLGDIRGALEKQGLSEVDIRAGDALFYHTGWCSLWKVDNDRFLSGTPDLTVRPSLRVACPSPAARQSLEMPEHRDQCLGEVDRLVVQRLAYAEFPYRLAGTT